MACLLGRDYLLPEVWWPGGGGLSGSRLLVSAEDVNFGGLWGVLKHPGSCCKVDEQCWDWKVGGVTGCSVMWQVKYCMAMRT